MSSPATLRLIALFEAAKGALVLLAGFGLLALVHRDLQQMAEHLVRHSHLNPASHYPRIFIDAAAHASNYNLRLLALLAALYALMRFVEAYGLWRARHWAEWFAVVSSGVYLPIELFELARRIDWMRSGIVLINLLVVIYLVRRLWLHRQATKARSIHPPDSAA